MNAEVEWAEAACAVPAQVVRTSAPELISVKDLLPFVSEAARVPLEELTAKLKVARLGLEQVDRDLTSEPRSSGESLIGFGVVQCPRCVYHYYYPAGGRGGVLA